MEDSFRVETLSLSLVSPHRDPRIAAPVAPVSTSFRPIEGEKYLARLQATDLLAAEKTRESPRRGGKERGMIVSHVLFRERMGSGGLEEFCFLSRFPFSLFFFRRRMKLGRDVCLSIPEKKLLFGSGQSEERRIGFYTGDDEDDGFERREEREGEFVINCCYCSGGNENFDLSDLFSLDCDLSIHQVAFFWKRRRES